ncbi:MAG: ATP-binding cassette domain-containing protein [Acidobacteria bacterium]|nr:ATP-binding cassette domain-containing protein [Acidobacteriota bacterium]
MIRELVVPLRGVLLGGLVLILVSRAASFVLPASSKFIVDEVIVKQNTEMLTPLVLAIIAATLLQAATAFSLTQVLSKNGQRMIAELRRRVQRHVGRLPVAYYDAHQTGVLVSRIMSDVEGVRNLVGTGLVNMVGGLLTAGVALVVLFTISAKLTLLALSIITIFILVLRSAFQKLRPAFKERRKISGEVTGRLTESLGGVRVIKGYRAEEREATVFSEGVERLLQNVYQTLTGTALVSVSAQLLLGGMGALIVWVGVQEITAGRLTAGDLASFTMFSAMFVAPLFQIVDVSTQLMEAFAGLERTREVLQERPEDDDPKRKTSIGPIEGSVCFEAVDFSYEPGKPVLRQVSFEAAPDTMTALVGPSGSGKSTIIGLLSAFHTPDAGRILVDGEDLSAVELGSYRSQLGLVLQETFLFDGSIRQNIAFARPDATDEQVLEACRIARVDEFAERFSEGYETIVGERGVKLSGGQRQRVAIARAVLANPRILILDEATSSLDSESEALIQEGLSYLMRGRTTFVIAHRLSTIRKADQILVIESGRVLERGTHETLYAAKGRYFDLYTKQHGLEANLFLAPGEGDRVEREKLADEERDGVSLRMLSGS